MPLFHITLVHDGAHCPGYHPEMQPALLQALEKREEIAGRYGVKIRTMLNAAPDHVIFVIAEADSPMQLAGCLTELLPFEQAEIRTHFVITFEDALEFAKARARQAGG